MTWLARRGLQAASAPDQSQSPERPDDDELPPVTGLAVLPWLLMTGLLVTAVGLLAAL